MFDTDKLIAGVEKRPCLWKAGNHLYGNKIGKQKAWYEIGKECFTDWSSSNKMEKLQKVHFMRKKWKQMRDYYIREKKRQNDDNGTKKKKINTNYFELLHFLDDLKPKRDSNIPDPLDISVSEIEYVVEDFDDDEDETTTGTDSQHNFPMTIQSADDTLSRSFDPEKQNRVCLASSHSEPIQPSISTQELLQPSTSTQPKRLKRPRLSIFERNLLKQLNQKDNDDPNRHFLLSLLPEMSKMTDVQNFQFRMEMLKALNKVKYQIPDSGNVHDWTNLISPTDSQSNSVSSVKSEHDYCHKGSLK